MVYPKFTVYKTDEFLEILELGVDSLEAAERIVNEEKNKSPNASFAIIPLYKEDVE